MKRLLLLIAIMIICTGCYGKEASPNVVEKPTDIEEPTDEVEQTGSVKFQAIVLSQNDHNLSVFVLDEDKGFRRFDPISVSYDTSELEVSMGDIIEISFDGTVAESYPMQIGADSVVIKEKVTDNWPATSTISDDYTSEEAVQDNYFVNVHGKVESMELLQSFIDNSKMGIIGYLRMVNYTIEGDPIITDIIYDGDKYYLFEDATRDMYAGEGSNIYKKEYSHLNTYEKDNIKTNYLANRDDITEEEFEKNQSSDKEEDVLDIFILK